MRRLQTTTLVVAGISTFLLTACGVPEGSGTASPSNPPSTTDNPGDSEGQSPSVEPTETKDELNPERLEGKWGSDETGEPFLEFKADGSVIGTDGCNGIATTYSIEGTVVTIDPWASTLRACDGVDGWLRYARTAEVSNSDENADELTVMDHDGKEIGTLIREK